MSQRRNVSKQTASAPRLLPPPPPPPPTTSSSARGEEFMKLSSTTTSKSRCSSSVHKCVPMYPAPPVTRTLGLGRATWVLSRACEALFLPLPLAPLTADSTSTDDPRALSGPALDNLPGTAEQESATPTCRDSCGDGLPRLSSSSSRGAEEAKAVD
eukprot:746902-Hanusia_phi.AAC.3